MSDKINMENLSRSLNGFEEIAVERKFGKSIPDITSVTILARALLFVNEKRKGLKDADAYEYAMKMSIADLEDQFEIPEQNQSLDVDGDDKGEA